MKKVMKFAMIAFALIILTMMMVPDGSVAASKEAIVKVEYPGYYTGTIKGDVQQNIEGEGTMVFQTRGDVIYVIMNKIGEDTQEMKVTLLVDEEERISRSTSEPMGEVRFSYSLGAEGSGDDDTDEEDDGSIGCGSIMIASVLLILVGVWSIVMSGRN